MKDFIRKKLAQMLKESQPETEVGGRDDIKSLSNFGAKPYAEILGFVNNDYGKESDLFKALYQLYNTPDKFDYKRFIEILQNYGVYDKYSHLLNLNEDN